MLLEVKSLKTYFYLDEGLVKAVDGVSFSVDKGKTLGIVGESGSGKTVASLSLLKLIPRPPGKIVEGEAWLDGVDLLRLDEVKLRTIRGARISMIFQDPMTSLNPVYTIGNQIGETIRVHQKVTWPEARKRAAELLEMVGIPKAKERLQDYPHQFSGGMRQRVMIAMALSCCYPDILIADEPTTALDVTIQAQILALLDRLRKETGMALILITHDLGVVAGMAEDVLVMYAGKAVEYANVETIYYRSRHPYTWGLMSSITRLDEAKKERLKPIKGLPPSLINLPKGCSFNPRCEYAKPICFGVEPKFEEISPGHWSACHFARVLELNGKKH